MKSKIDLITIEKEYFSYQEFLKNPRSILNDIMELMES
jgi:hypothetical protein